MPHKKISELYEFAKKRMAIKAVWIAPIVATVVLLILTALKISGSSIVVYDSLLPSTAKTTQVVGEPRTVRSDEWLVNTPFIFSQEENDFPVFNSDIASGQDMSVVVDVPYKEWSALFKPQNLAFFVLPLGFAFAFKWWSLLWILFIATYALLLVVSPKRHLRAAMLASFFCLSPFVHWWYQSITILPIAYMFAMIALAIKMVSYNKSQRKKRLISAVALGYLASCFILVMYPAFQIVCGLVGVGIFAGYVIDKKLLKKILEQKTWVLYSISIIAALSITALFIYAHRGPLSVLTQTVYPGSRDIASGGTNIANLLNWPLGYVSTFDPTAFANNQSETSRFWLLGFLLTPLLLWNLKISLADKKRYGDKSLLLIMVAIVVLFIARSTLKFGDPAYKILGLHLVPHVRLVIGFGMINLIFMALAFKVPQKSWQNLRSLFDIRAFIQMTFAGVSIFLAAYYVDAVFGIQSVGINEIVVVALVIGLVVGLLSHSVLKLRYAGLVIACIASGFIAIQINPLSRGVGAIKESALSQYIKSTESRNDSYWISDSDSILSAIPLAAGAEVFSGVETYPQIEVWDRFFPGKDDIFNRYAHISFVVDDSQKNRSLELIQADSFGVHISSCDPMLQQLNIHYIIAKSQDIKKYACFRLQKTFFYNGSPVSIYSREQD